MQGAALAVEQPLAVALVRRLGARGLAMRTWDRGGDGGGDGTPVATAQHRGRNHLRLQDQKAKRQDHRGNAPRQSHGSHSRTGSMGQQAEGSGRGGPVPLTGIPRATATAAGNAVYSDWSPKGLAPYAGGPLSGIVPALD